MHKVRLYIACSWFNPEQVANMERAHALLKNNPSVDWEGSYRPVEHQWGGHVFGQDPEEDERWYNNRDWQAHTYYEDLLGLNRSEMCLFVQCDFNEDPGQAFELGYAVAQHKPCVMALIDPTCKDHPLNLMLAVSPDRFIAIDDLDTFDFNNFGYEYCPGKVY